MQTAYEIRFERVHFRTSRLTYRDQRGTLEAHFEESTVPEFDWVGAEPDFQADPGRLQEVVPRIHAWAHSQGIVLKIWKEDELGR